MFSFHNNNCLFDTTILPTTATVFVHTQLHARLIELQLTVVCLVCVLAILWLYCFHKILEFNTSSIDRLGAKLVSPGHLSLDSMLEYAPHLSTHLRSWGTIMSMCSYFLKQS